MKTAGWALIRDKMLNKEHDASHFLSPMPLAISLGTGSAAQPMRVATIQNINGQAITLHVKHKDKRLPTAVPTDPLIYRFYELVNAYGSTFKALIHEEFGDGIMSAIDFDLDLTRMPHEKGDRVKIVMSGKYLQYKTY